MIEELSNTHRHGAVTWIGISSGRRSEIQSVPSVMVESGKGLAGDHHAASGSGGREVTLIQQEHLPIIAAFLGQPTIEPALLRRNILVSGINLLQFLDRRFQVGEVLLEGCEPCDPCGRMEENLGTGGLKAMIGHGGIVARVLQGGNIQVGDEVRPAD